MSNAAGESVDNQAQPELWGASDGAHGAETGDAGDELASMLRSLQCSRMHVYREKPLYASGYLGSIELQPGDAPDFDAIHAEWGGGTLRFRPLREDGRFAPGSKTYKFSGPPRYQGREIRPDGSTAETRQPNPAPAAAVPAMTMRAAIPQSKDPAVNALADIVTQLLSALAGGSARPDPARELSGYAKSLAEAQRLLNPPADDDDDDDTGGATGMDPSALMMMMMMNQGGGGAPGQMNPMMMLLPQLMNRGGGGGGALGGMDPMMMMMMMNQAGGAPGGTPPMGPPQQQPPWQQQQQPPWQQQQQQQPAQGGGMNPAMLAFLMQQQQQAAQRAQQQRPAPSPTAPPQQQQQAPWPPEAPAWAAEPEPEPEPEPAPPRTAPRPVDDDPYKF